jgi:hypothetical protein
MIECLVLVVFVFTRDGDGEGKFRVWLREVQSMEKGSSEYGEGEFRVWLRWKVDGRLPLS